ncbi:hypothetical protein D9758_013038 [Tetrapyrgos nigripes]|uniref:Peptidase A1 domain-containing protein n=1 Tax=Tetrapyrgos nigripes TaxID=182062 RepID=A0A8H5CPP8_9AGAR|nr:hypothetical protein D9758_013038 [Tetrapyrgos nigripes]
MPLLPSTTNDFIFPCLSPLDLFRYSLSCRDAHADVSSYFRRAFSIHAFLSFYFFTFAEIERFRWIQKATGALIAGPSALEFFDRLRLDTKKSFLEIFVQYSFVPVVADFLESIGYRFMPVEPLSRDAEDREQGQDGIRASQSFATVVKRDYHTSLGLLNSSYVFVRETDTEDDRAPQTRRIQLRTSMQIPLEVILDRSHSTCYMNLISNSHAIALYPRAAFENRLSVILSSNVSLNNVITDPEWKLLGYEGTFPDLTEQHLKPFFPNTVRRIGDEHCWIIPLPLPSNLDVDGEPVPDTLQEGVSDKDQDYCRPRTSTINSAKPSLGDKMIRLDTTVEVEWIQELLSFLPFSLLHVLFLASSSDSVSALKFPVIGRRSDCLPNHVDGTGAFGNGSTVLNTPAGPFLYTTNVTVGGVPFEVQIDTGSSDLWVLGNVTKTHNTSIPAALGYAIGIVEGHVNTAEVMFDGFTISDQAYLFAEAVENVPTIPGFIGLGPSSLSQVLANVERANRSDINGAPFVDRIFKQNMTPNFISFVLQRSNETAEIALVEEQFGQLTIGEMIPEYEERIPAAPKLPALVDQFGVQHWQTLLDSNGIIGHDGERIETKTEISNPTEGGLNQLHVVVDTGFSLSQIPHEIIDAMYGRVPGAEYIKNGSDLNPGLGALGINDVWRIPCDYELNVSFIFAGVEIPVSPLDLTVGSADALQDANGVDICFALFQQISTSVAGNTSFGAIDAILGPSFLRNVYTVINFGDFVDGSNDTIADPYIQLLPTLDKAKAHQDFVNQRLGGVDTTASQAPLLPMSQMKHSPYMGGGFATTQNLAESNDHYDSDQRDNEPWYKRTRNIIGISIGGAILCGLILAIVLACTQRRHRSKVRSEAPFVPPIGSYKPLFDAGDAPRTGPYRPLLDPVGAHAPYSDTAYRPPMAKDVNDDGVAKYDPARS